MKILKYLLLLLVVAIAGFLIYVTVQPDSYDVKRSRVIKAPANVIFENINEYKNWQDWGPWMEEDPTIEATYPEQTSGVGAYYTWTSKDGPGKIETISLIENKSIDQKIYFGDYEPSDVYWTLEETEEGTNVTWGMKSEKNPFIFKVFGALAGGMEKMLGPMHEKGLDNLDKVIQEHMKNNPPKPKAIFKVGEATPKEVTAQTFIGYPQKTKIDHENMTKLFMEFMPKAGQYAAESKLEHTAYTPAAVFTKWDEENGEAEFYIGLLLNDTKLAPAEGMEKVDLPAGNTVMISKYGNYGTGDMEAHMAIDAYLKANSLEQNGPIWELYVNDPGQVKPEEIQTDIYYPVK